MAGLLNPGVRRDAAFTGLFDERAYQDVARFYQRHPELEPTPLRALPRLARQLGIAELLVKDETCRFGVEAFKIAGVRYAAERLEPEALGRGLVCATAGNHGRAVARVARDLHVPCTVFIPAPREGAGQVELRVRGARIASMRADGATTVDVPGTYEEAVAMAAAHGLATGATIVSDTSWPGYDEIPRWIMAGYTRLFDEASRQWRTPPDLILVQGGVGGLVCAAASWCAARYRGERPFLIACEPDSSACLLESARAGRLVNLDTVGHGDGGSREATMMAGLRCAEPSAAAWPAIASGIDAFVSIPDAVVVRAMAALAADEPGIDAGPSGACGVGALMAIASDPQLAEVREASGLSRSTRALAVVTEGP